MNMIYLEKKKQNWLYSAILSQFHMSSLPKTDFLKSENLEKFIFDNTKVLKA